MGSTVTRVLVGMAIIVAVGFAAARLLPDRGQSTETTADAPAESRSGSSAIGEDDSDTGPSTTAGEEVAVLRRAPELVGITDWLNTDGSSFEEVRSDVTVVQFWTFGCRNCKATLPHLQALYDARREEGLEIIGVHAHEFDYERDPANVAQAVVDLGVTWPVALDTDKESFIEWQGSPRFWPRTYVVDRNNQIRFDHIGEGQYDELATTIDTLLADEG